jgi:hypothetical protein
MTPDSVNVGEGVVHAVASATDTDPLELPALYETIDPDALNAIIGSMADGKVVFEYADCTVTVDSLGDIYVDGSSPDADGSEEGARDVVDDRGDATTDRTEV